VHAFSPALDTDLNAMRRVLEVNTIAPLAVTQAFAPLLIKTGSLATEPTTAPAKARAKPLPPPPAVVLNIGSAAVAGVPFMGVYGASKAALQTLSDTMRREMAALGVRVVTLELGSVRTAMSSGDKTQDLARTDRLWGFYPNIKAIRASVERLMIATVDAAPTAEIVARQIVDAVASKNPPPKLWLGNPSTLSRWVYPFLPIWVLDYLYDKYAGGNLVMHPTETPQHESAAEGALTGDSAAHN
jgi:NAD(P)-dependent dehydrogenase (short-subunit alcohol dehydrogenase family)